MLRVGLENPAVELLGLRQLARLVQPYGGLQRPLCRHAYSPQTLRVRQQAARLAGFQSVSRGDASQTSSPPAEMIQRRGGIRGAVRRGQAFQLAYSAPQAVCQGSASQ